MGLQMSMKLDELDEARQYIAAAKARAGVLREAWIRMMNLVRLDDNRTQVVKRLDEINDAIEALTAKIAECGRAADESEMQVSLAVRHSAANKPLLKGLFGKKEESREIVVDPTASYSALRKSDMISEVRDKLFEERGSLLARLKQLDRDMDVAKAMVMLCQDEELHAIMTADDSLTGEALSAKMDALQELVDRSNEELLALNGVKRDIEALRRVA